MCALLTYHLCYKDIYKEEVQMQLAVVLQQQHDKVPTVEKETTVSTPSQKTHITSHPHNIVYKLQPQSNLDKYNNKFNHTWRS